ncbi:hypothetical protein EDD85DRAFT_260861 [Armillaria nabsnona]|nr:hypothetical protein EDD85DRAFT_260861 [Armillaria nabsnona]
MFYSHAENAYPLATDVTTVKEMMEMIKQEMQTTKKEISGEFGSLREEIKALESKVAALEKEFTNLKKKVEEFAEGDISASKSTIGTWDRMPLTRQMAILLETLLFHIQDYFCLPVALLILQKKCTSSCYPQPQMCARPACHRCSLIDNPVICLLRSISLFVLPDLGFDKSGDYETMSLISPLLRQLSSCQKVLLPQFSLGASL